MFISGYTEWTLCSFPGLQESAQTAGRLEDCSCGSYPKGNAGQKVRKLSTRVSATCVLKDWLGMAAKQRMLWSLDVRFTGSNPLSADQYSHLAVNCLKKNSPLCKA